MASVSAREADDDVSRQSDLRPRGTQLLNHRKILFARIMAVHLFENFIVARLNRQMQMRHQVLELPIRADQIVGQVFGMRGHKANARNLQPVEPIKKIGKFRAAAAIGIHVLPQQHDFLNAGIAQAQRFLDDRFRLARALSATDVRNDTVCAEVIAAVHDIYKRTEFTGTHFRHSLDDLAVDLLDLDDRLALAQHAIEVFRQPIKIMRSVNQINEGIFFLHDLPPMPSSCVMQPPTQIRSSGLSFFSSFSQITLPSALFSAFSRTQQVL